MSIAAIGIAPVHARVVAPIARRHRERLTLASSASRFDSAPAASTLGFALRTRRRSAARRPSSRHVRADAVTSSSASSKTESGGNTTLVVAGAVAVCAIAATHASGSAIARAGGSAVLGCLLALVGYKKKSLDASGAIAAIGVGFGSIYADARFGAALAAFFFTSSAVTRVRSDVKRRVDEHFKVGGGRDWVQVFANGFVPTMIALAYAFGATGSNAGAMASAYLGYYACCGGDTWASELGVLSTSKPRLITNWTREVDAGTNGGVTALGWVASASGGAAVGAAFHLVQVILRAFAPNGSVRFAPSSALELIVFGAVAGVFGSLVDSVLGATIQFSGWCSARQKVVSKPGPSVERISGLEILSNSAVNLVSGIVTAVVAAVFFPL